MAEPKFKLPGIAKLFPDAKDQTLQDKQLIEALRQRLNEKLQDPKAAKKAALILEAWINQKSR
jgi:hypothetical protein